MILLYWWYSVIDESMRTHYEWRDLGILFREIRRELLSMFVCFLSLQLSTPRKCFHPRTFLKNELDLFPWTSFIAYLHTIHSNGGNRTKLPSSRWRRRGSSLREVFACSCFFATTDLCASLRPPISLKFTTEKHENTEAWYILHQNDRPVSVLVFVQWSPKDSPRYDGRQIRPK